jgi:hypothetical protein
LAGKGGKHRLVLVRGVVPPYIQRIRP